jgi:hypothetical protein
MRLFRKTNLKALVLGAVLAGAGGCSMDYEAADPVADARSALDKGDFHLVAVRVGDSVVSPIDSVYQNTSINVEVGPSGGMHYLKLVEDRDRPGVPSRAQMQYMQRFNTEMFRMIEENARPPRRS